MATPQEYKSIRYSIQFDIIRRMRIRYMTSPRFNADSSLCIQLPKKDSSLFQMTQMTNSKAQANNIVTRSADKMKRIRQLQSKCLNSTQSESKTLRNFETAKDKSIMKRINTEMSATRTNFIETHDESSIQRVKILQKFKSGNFGTVYRAVLTSNTYQQVAVKKVEIDPNHISREQEFARKLKNPYIVNFIGVYYSEDMARLETEGKQQAVKKKFLNIIMQRYPQNLHEVILNSIKNKIDPLMIKLYFYEMLRAVNYLHSLNICHRDIKPHNFLVTKSGRVALCDFGASKVIHSNDKIKKNVSYIFSREYRAPQLLFDCEDYGIEVDIWALGCVAAEMMLKKPLFNGSSILDQIAKILRVLGSPQWQKVSFIKRNNKKIPKIPHFSGRGLPELMSQNTEPAFIRLIEKMIQIEPKNRITAIEALCDPYFDELREQSVYKGLLLNFNQGSINPSQNIPNLFYFSKRQIFGKQHLLNKLIPYWLKQYCKRFEVSIKDFKFVMK